MEVVARGHEVTILDHDAGKRRTFTSPDPMKVCLSVVCCGCAGPG